MKVLLTNDDGIMASGLKAMYFALKRAGHTVTAVAPMRQQSGVSHHLTVFEPLRFSPIADGEFTGVGIYGTPSDCVRLALGDLLEYRPDIVISGINQGRNAGPDLLYSGTVAAAAEGANDALPSIALSYAGQESTSDLDNVADHAVRLAEGIDWSRVPPRRVINVNYPGLPVAETAGIRVCAQSPAVFKNNYTRRKDPRGNSYWWLSGDNEMDEMEAETDRALLEKGYITITPLKFDYTDAETMKTLQDMGF